jgi:hypothetical protein
MSNPTGATMSLEERISRLEQLMVEQKKCTDKQGEQLCYIMEQVTLGKHMVVFAKLMGWIIGVLATVIEVWRAFRGN